MRVLFGTQNYGASTRLALRWYGLLVLLLAVALAGSGFCYLLPLFMWLRWDGWDTTKSIVV